MIFIGADGGNKTLNAVNELEKIEPELCNIPSVFAEILKNEINANDEQKLYNGIKRIVRKYSQQKNGIQIINELVRVLCGGATLDEILEISKEEALNPTTVTDIVADSTCYLESKEPDFH
ncbi:UNVERIFIED_CONTAM: hypothetical protein Cloal_0082 [Acetivibrio alkalicellulosi]